MEPGSQKREPLTHIIISRTKDMIFGKSGHPDQIPYIVTWEDFIAHPAPWLKLFISTGLIKKTIFALQKDKRLHGTLLSK